MRLLASSSKPAKRSAAGCWSGPAKSSVHASHSPLSRYGERTVLRRPTQHTRKRRLVPPYALHPSIVVLFPLQPRYPLGVFRLYLLHTNQIVLGPPVVAVVATNDARSAAVVIDVERRGKRLALRIHRKMETTSDPAADSTTSGTLAAKCSALRYAIPLASTPGHVVYSWLLLPFYYRGHTAGAVVRLMILRHSCAFPGSWIFSPLISYARTGLMLCSTVQEKGRIVLQGYTRCRVHSKAIVAVHGNRIRE